MARLAGGCNGLNPYTQRTDTGNSPRHRSTFVSKEPLTLNSGSKKRYASAFEQRAGRLRSTGSNTILLDIGAFQFQVTPFVSRRDLVQDRQPPYGVART